MIRVFNSKISGYLLNAAGVWIKAFTEDIDRLLISFLPGILGPQKGGWYCSKS